MTEGKYVNANGLEIYYKEYGGGRPLVLLHGATDTHTLWEPFIDQFSGSFHVFTPDSRGHGRTINPFPGLSYRLLADDLAGFCEALDLEKPSIFGYSDGGQAALDFGMRYSDIPGALVIGGAWYRFSEQYQNSLSRAGFVGPAEIDFPTFERYAPGDWRARMQRAHPNSDPDYPHTLLRELAALFWTPLNYQKQDFQKILAPALVLVGENDEMVPPEESREMVELIPDAELAVIPGAAHSGVLVPGGDFIELVLSFFKRNLGDS